MTCTRITNYLSNFSENLSELIEDNRLTVEAFAESVDIAFSEIYRYLRKEYMPKLSNLIKIADAYGYSLDFLIGLIPFPENAKFKTASPFGEQLKKLLKEKGVSRYRMSKETGISLNRIDSWYHGEFTPSLEKAIKLKKYFDCTLDYLLGRET